MIARHDGRVLLVSGAIPGERVTATIERVARGVSYATVHRVDEPSPDRREPGFDPLCGGCLYAHIAYARQLELKGEVIADAFARIGRLRLPDRVEVVASPHDEGYRMRARLHVRGHASGFFREGSHDLCDARPTRQLLPATCDLLDRLASLVAGTDGIRELELSENVEASARVVHLVPGARVEAAAVEHVAEIEGLTGLTLGGWSASDPPAIVLSGDPHVVDAVTCGSRTVGLQRHVLSFFQGNRHLLQDLVSHVGDLVPRAASVVDLYAGTGLFAVTAAAGREARVIAVEGDRASAEDLQVNARQVEGAVELVHESVEMFTSRSRPAPDAMIVDPPRTGMSREALEGAIRLGARRIVYVSCDVATLARDAKRLVDAGYAIVQVRGFDLFPNTPHVESVVVFDRTA